MTNLGDRIIVLIDMDCFFCQVETKLQPEYKGKPLAVVQYSLWKSGGIIAVNYEARDFGVTRHMRADEAKEKCPDIVLAIVPSLREKADTSRYRSAGKEVIEVLKKHCNKIERASIDEAYLDITQIVDDQMSSMTISPNDMMKRLNTTFIIGHSEVGLNYEEQRSNGLQEWLNNSFDELNDIQAQRLAVAGLIVEEIRADVYKKTEFRCSAGISYNKILAKLACGLHKPNRQTILPAAAVPSLFSTLPVKKVRNLGGKFGDIVIESLKCNVMADLLQYSLSYLQNRFDEKTGLWLYNIARGVDNEPVTTRLVSKSIGACKKFPGKQAITKLDVLKHWISELAAEVCERLQQDAEENERRATLLTVSYQYLQNSTVVSQSRSYHLNSYKHEKIANQCFEVVSKSTQQPIIFVGLSAGKFIRAKGSENFINFFKPSTQSDEKNESQSSDTKNDFETKSNILEEEFQEKNKTIQSFFKVANKIESPKVNISVSSSSINDSLKNSEKMKSFFVNKIESSRTKNSVPSFSTEDALKTSEKLKKSFFLNILKDKYESEKSDEAKENKISKNEDTNIAVKLEEIFPDLNDIDPNILSCLPVQLQKEASQLLKSKKPDAKCLDSSTEIRKVGKPKVSKIKSQKQEKHVNSINSFLIKTSTNGESGKNFQKCTQCGQMIPVDKVVEHNDFHVAQSLQKVINKSVAGVKRKNSQDAVNDSDKKRQADESTR